MQAFSERVPPQDLEAEQSVLGACLLDKDVLAPVRKLLSPEDFYADKNQWVYDAICRVSDRRDPVDIQTVMSELRGRNRLDEVGGMEYLFTVNRMVPSTARAETYARIVADKALLRRIQKAARLIVDTCYESPEADKARAFSVDQIHQAVFSRESSVVKHVGTDLLHFMDEMHQVVQDGEQAKLIVRTGLALQDEILPLYVGETTVAVAQSNIGKTTWEKNLCYNVARLGDGEDGRPFCPVLSVSLEMSKTQIMQKTWGRVAGINTRSIRRMKLTDRDWLDSSLAVARICEYPWFYAAKPGMTWAEIRLEAMAFKAKHGALALLTVDYWQILGDPVPRGDRRDAQLGRLVGDAKALATELGCHVVIVAQAKILTNKPIPENDDVAESRDIVRWADNVLFLTRPVEFGKSDIRLPSLDGRTWFDLKCDAPDPLDPHRPMFHNVMLGIPGKARMDQKAIIPFYCDMATGFITDLAQPWPWDNPRGMPRQKQEVRD